MASSRKANEKPNLATQPSIPAKFRCKVGGEWKPINAFSANQQRLIQRQIDSRRPIDAAHSGMTCRDHTAGSREELRCEICGLNKPIDQFSKSSRRNGIHHCIRCSAWVETQEPDVTPAPLETGHISAEEAKREVWQGNFMESTDFFGDGLPQAPITSMSSLGLEDLEAGEYGPKIQAILESNLVNTAFRSFSGDFPSSSTSSSCQTIPPHLRNKVEMTSQRSKSRTASYASAATPSERSEQSFEPGASTRSASSAGVGSSAANKLPPHLQGRIPLSTVQKTPGSGSVSTATTMRETKDAVKVGYNAWDASGTLHKTWKSPTVRSGGETSTSASETGETSETSDDSQQVGWEKVSGKKPVAMRPTTGKWPKTSEIRIPQSEIRRQAAAESFVASRIDSDVDLQRRYCNWSDDEEGSS